MVVLNPDAQSQLTRYLRQMRAALRGHPSVDPDDIERDVLGHIDAELAGHPEPVVATDLRRVLDRLGAPSQWAVSEEQTPWWGLISSLRDGPEDWRLAYLSLTLAFVGAAVFLGNGWMWLWPLPLLLPIVAFFMARATLELLEHHEEPIGARRWLLYPVLLPWYGMFAAALLLWPMGPVLGLLNDTEEIQAQLERSSPEWFWALAPTTAAMVLGLWWAGLGLILRRFPPAARAAFRPFADGVDRRHGTRLALVGMLIAAAAGGIFAIILI
jgi:hypothetical protein